MTALGAPETVALPTWVALIVAIATPTVPLVVFLLAALLERQRRGRDDRQKKRERERESLAAVLRATDEYRRQSHGYLYARVAAQSQPEAKPIEARNLEAANASVSALGDALAVAEVTVDSQKVMTALTGVADARLRIIQQAERAVDVGGYTEADVLAIFSDFDHAARLMRTVIRKHLGLEVADGAHTVHGPGSPAGLRSDETV